MSIVRGVLTALALALLALAASVEGGDLLLRSAQLRVSAGRLQPVTVLRAPRLSRQVLRGSPPTTEVRLLTRRQLEFVEAETAYREIGEIELDLLRQKQAAALQLGLTAHNLEAQRQLQLLRRQQQLGLYDRVNTAAILGLTAGCY